MLVDPNTSLPTRLSLIADDLTGACDAGVQFSQQGFSCAVQLGSPLSEALNPDVLILNTHSRHDRPVIARAKVEDACRLIARTQRRLIYKKIDSTLKGNLGPEIAAAMTAGGFRLAIVAPAYPSMGRVLVKGKLWIAGETPSKPTSLPSLLRRQGLKNIAACVRGDAAAFMEKLEDISKKQTAVAVLDAETEDDLSLIAQAALKFSIEPLLVGSAGFAAAVAECYSQERRAKSTSRSTDQISGHECGSVVLVIGSTNPITENQVRQFVAKRPVMVVSPGPAIKTECRQAVQERRPLLFNVGPHDKDKQRLAELLTIVEGPAMSGLVLSGGDTAELACRLLQAEGIALEAEILPGIPWGKFMGGRAEGLPVATKAGGFGQPDALIRMVDFLATRERHLR